MKKVTILFIIISLFSISSGQSQELVTEKQKHTEDSQATSKDVILLDSLVKVIKTPALHSNLFPALSTFYKGDGDCRIIENDLISIIESGPTDDFAVTNLAISCLKKIKSEKATPILYEKMMHLLSNPDHELFKKEIKFFSDGDGYLPKSIGEYYISEYQGGLAGIGGDGVRKLVLPMLESDNELIKYKGAMILGSMGDVVAVPILCEKLGKSKEPNTRLGLVLTLGKLGDQRAVPFLIKALKDKYNGWSDDYPVRRAAYLSLLKMGVNVVQQNENTYKVLK